MVLEFGNEDLVPFANIGTSICGCDEVERFGGAGCEDDFVSGVGIDECSDGISGCFVLCSRLLRECVSTAVHVGIDGIVVGCQCRCDVCWFLRGGRRIEVDERFAGFWIIADSFGEDGEVVASGLSEGRL